MSPTFVVLKVPLEVPHDSGIALFTTGMHSVLGGDYKTGETGSEQSNARSQNSTYLERVSVELSLLK